MPSHPAVPRRWLPALLALPLLVAGCSVQDADPVVTVVSTVTPAGEQPTTTRGSGTAPGTGTTSSTRRSTAAPTPPTRAPRPTSSATSSGPASGDVSTSNPAGNPTGNPTGNAPDADPDTPGPETGPRCATDGQYVDEQPTGLRSDVITAWRRVEREANADGVIVCLNDGKRSRGQQLAQYQRYVEQYGKEVADQLVLPPEKSAHVLGIAIDVQPQAAYRWLQATKGSLGFCRTYDNEPWHFEYDVAYRTDGCPARLPKPQR